MADLQDALHRYYLASCRGIWKLLPQEESRRGVEMAERWLWRWAEKRPTK